MNVQLEQRFPKSGAGPPQRHKSFLGELHWCDTLDYQRKSIGFCVDVGRFENSPNYRKGALQKKIHFVFVCYLYRGLESDAVEGCLKTVISELLKWQHDVFCDSLRLCENSWNVSPSTDWFSGLQKVFFWNIFDFLGLWLLSLWWSLEVRT